MATKITIEAGKADQEYLKDLWRFRELFYVLAWRNISVRYKQTVIGVAWALLRPALSTVVFTIIFGKLGKFPASGVPYPVLVLAGMLPWQLVSAAFTESGQSLIANSALITKVYFPRIIVPASAIITSVVDFGISLVMLGVVMAIYGIAPGWQVVFLPAFTLLALASAAGMGTFIAALNVKYRDFSFVVPFISQLGLYASPVGFSSAVVPQRWKLLYSLNPLVGIIDGFRWCLLRGRVPMNWSGLALSIGVVAAFGITGFLYFRRTERGFADII